MRPKTSGTHLRPPFFLLLCGLVRRLRHSLGAQSPARRVPTSSSWSREPCVPDSLCTLCGPGRRANCRADGHRYFHGCAAYTGDLATRCPWVGPRSDDSRDPNVRVARAPCDPARAKVKDLPPPTIDLSEGKERSTGYRDLTGVGVLSKWLSPWVSPLTVRSGFQRARRSGSLLGPRSASGRGVDQDVRERERDF